MSDIGPKLDEPAHKKAKIVFPKKLSLLSKIVPSVHSQVGQFYLSVKSFQNGDVHPTGKNILNWVLEDRDHHSIAVCFWDEHAIKYKDIPSYKVIYIQNFDLIENNKPGKYLSVPNPSSFNFSEMTKVTVNEEFVIEQETPKKWASLAEVQKQQRNVLLEYCGEQSFDQHEGFVDVLQFKTSDDKKIRIVFFHSHVHHGAQLMTGKRYIVRGVYLHHKFELKFSDQEIIGTEDTRFDEVEEETNEVVQTSTLREIKDGKLANGVYNLTVFTTSASCEGEVTVTDGTETDDHSIYLSVVNLPSDSIIDVNTELSGNFRLNVQKGVLHLLAVEDSLIMKPHENPLPDLDDFEYVKYDD